MLQDYYSSYGIDYANANIANNDLEYSMNVGNYNSMYLYNEAMLRKRQGDNVYPENEGYDWDWNSSENRLKYRRMFEASSNLGKVADFAVAGLIINRMIAAINYIYYLNQQLIVVLNYFRNKRFFIEITINIIHCHHTHCQSSLMSRTTDMR